MYWVLEVARTKRKEAPRHQAQPLLGVCIKCGFAGLDVRRRERLWSLGRWWTCLVAPGRHRIGWTVRGLKFLVVRNSQAKIFSRSSLNLVPQFLQGREQD